MGVPAVRVGESVRERWQLSNLDADGGRWKVSWFWSESGCCKRGGLDAANSSGDEQLDVRGSMDQLTSLKQSSKQTFTPLASLASQPAQ